jgi:hypothetical protein
MSQASSDTQATAVTASRPIPARSTLILIGAWVCFFVAFIVLGLRS